jgi:hypothetical protein
MLSRARCAESSKERLPLDSVRDVFDRAVTINRKRDGGFGATSGSDLRVDGVLQPVLADGTHYGLNVPGIAASKVAATRALNRDTAAVDRTGRGDKAGRNPGGAIVPGNGIVLIGRFLWDDLGRPATRKRLFLREPGNLHSGRPNLRSRGKRFFLVKSLGGVDNAAVGDVSGLKHGNASGGDDIDFEAGIAATDTAPLIAGTLKPDAREHDDGDSEVQEYRIKQEALEGELVGGGDGVGHFRVVTYQFSVRRHPRFSCSLPILFYAGRRPGGEPI